MTRRRTVLAGAATLLVAGVGAGCTGFTASDDAPVLRSITLRNMDDEAHELGVRLTRRGDEILDTNYRLGPRTLGDDADHVAAIEDAWDDATGAFTATVELDRDGESAEMRLDAGVSAGPYRYEIRVTEDARIEGWYAALSTTTA